MYLMALEKKSKHKRSGKRNNHGSLEITELKMAEQYTESIEPRIESSLRFHLIPD